MPNPDLRQKKKQPRLKVVESLDPEDGEFLKHNPTV